MGDKKLLYINIDGFSYAYLERLMRRRPGGPFARLLRQGMLFSNLHSGLISITNPMQSAILSGAWSNKTHNFYQHYDWENACVVRHRRTFDAENAAEGFVRQGKTVASIHQFMLENNPCRAGDPACAYLTCGEEHSTSLQRFALLRRLLRGETVSSGGRQWAYSEWPDFTALYVDDIDSLGHNNDYGPYPRRARVEERLQDLEERLQLIGEELLRLTAACRERGLLEDLLILVTTDHGMTPFFGKSRLPDLLARLRAAGVRADPPETRTGATRVVALPYTMELSLYCAPGLAAAEKETIARVCRAAPYVHRVYDRAEMQRDYGLDRRGPDFLLAPRAGDHFYHRDIAEDTFAASHDSDDETSQHIFGLLLGGGAACGRVYDRPVSAIDLFPTLLKTRFGFSLRDSTGAVFDDWFPQEACQPADPE